MTTKPTTGSSSGWDQAIYRCGRCGAEYTVTTEEAYLQAVGVHTDAHAVWDRLNHIERDGITSILRTILSAPELGFEFLALADRQHLTGSQYVDDRAAPSTRPPGPGGPSPSGSTTEEALVTAPAQRTPAKVDAFSALTICFTTDLAAIVGEENAGRHHRDRLHRPRGARDVLLRRREP